MLSLSLHSQSSPLHSKSASLHSAQDSPDSKPAADNVAVLDADGSGLISQEEADLQQVTEEESTHSGQVLDPDVMRFAMASWREAEVTV